MSLLKSCDELITGEAESLSSFRTLPFLPLDHGSCCAASSSHTRKSTRSMPVKRCKGERDSPSPEQLHYAQPRPVGAASRIAFSARNLHKDEGCQQRALLAIAS